jgi:hypothetical protein
MMLIFLAIGLPISAQEFPKNIWFGGVDPVVQRDRHVTEPADFMDLFAAGAPWKVGASKVIALKISTQLVLRGTDAQLRTVIEGLKRKQIGLGIELGVLVYSERCGKHTEGYGAPLAVEAVCKRIKSLGGQLDYVAMDEPVTWGHAVKSKSGQGDCRCQDPIPALVEQVAPKIALLKSYFPNVQIGEIDAISSRGPHGVDDIILFNDLLHKRTGLRLAFMHADVAWNSDWQPLLRDLIKRMHGRHLRVGVVFNGDLNARSSQEWIAQAIRKYQLLMNDPTLAPDDLVFQSWSNLPDRMLPETDPAAWTYALRYAVQSEGRR